MRLFYSNLHSVKNDDKHFKSVTRCYKKLQSDALGDDSEKSKKRFHAAAGWW